MFTVNQAGFGLTPQAVNCAQVSAGETHAPIFWHIVCLVGATVSASSNIYTEVCPAAATLGEIGRAHV